MEEYRLSDLFELQMGKTPDRNNELYWNEGVNDWISIADLSKCKKYIVNTKEKITDIAIKKSGIKSIPENTVVMSFKLSIGKLAITQRLMYSNEAIMAFLDKQVVELDSNYVYYLFMYKNWESGTNKAVMGKTLNKSTLSQIKVKIHRKFEQKRIVKILDKVCFIIQKREQQLKELDNLIKSRFVEMFGDPMSNPKKWNVMTFREAGTRLSDGPFGSNLKSEHYTEKGIRVIRLGNIGVNKFIDEDQVYISNEHYEKIKKYTCRAGEIIIGTLGEPNLRACIIPKYVEYAINKADCVHYVPKAELLNVYFTCQYINCPETLLLAIGMIHGQTRARISSGQIAEMPIFIPPLEAQNQFAAFACQIDKLKLHIGSSDQKASI